MKRDLDKHEHDDGHDWRCVIMTELVFSNWRKSEEVIIESSNQYHGSPLYWLCIKLQESFKESLPDDPLPQKYPRLYDTIIAFDEQNKEPDYYASLMSILVADWPPGIGFQYNSANSRVGGLGYCRDKQGRFWAITEAEIIVPGTKLTHADEFIRYELRCVGLISDSFATLQAKGAKIASKHGYKDPVLVASWTLQQDRLTQELDSTGPPIIIRSAKQLAELKRQIEQFISQEDEIARADPAQRLLESMYGSPDAEDSENAPDVYLVDLAQFKVDG